MSLALPYLPEAHQALKTAPALAHPENLALKDRQEMVRASRMRIEGLLKDLGSLEESTGKDVDVKLQKQMAEAQSMLEVKAVRETPVHKNDQNNMLSYHTNEGEIGMFLENIDAQSGQVDGVISGATATIEEYARFKNMEMDLIDAISNNRMSRKGTALTKMISTLAESKLTGVRRKGKKVKQENGKFKIEKKGLIVDETALDPDQIRQMSAAENSYKGVNIFLVNNGKPYFNPALKLILSTTIAFKEHRQNFSIDAAQDMLDTYSDENRADLNEQGVNKMQFQLLDLPAVQSNEDLKQQVLAMNTKSTSTEIQAIVTAVLEGKDIAKQQTYPRIQMMKQLWKCTKSSDTAVSRIFQVTQSEKQLSEGMQKRTGKKIQVVQHMEINLARLNPLPDEMQSVMFGDHAMFINSTDDNWKINPLVQSLLPGTVSLTYAIQSVQDRVSQGKEDEEAKVQSEVSEKMKEFDGYQKNLGKMQEQVSLLKQLHAVDAVMKPLENTLLPYIKKRGFEFSDYEQHMVRTSMNSYFLLRTLIGTGCDVSAHDERNKNKFKKVIDDLQKWGEEMKIMMDDKKSPDRNKQMTVQKIPNEILGMIHRNPSSLSQAVTDETPEKFKLLFQRISIEEADVLEQSLIGEHRKRYYNELKKGSLVNVNSSSTSISPSYKTNDKDITKNGYLQHGHSLATTHLYSDKMRYALNISDEDLLNTIQNIEKSIATLQDNLNQQKASYTEVVRAKNLFEKMKNKAIDSGVEQRAKVYNSMQEIYLKNDEKIFKGSFERNIESFRETAKNVQTSALEIARLKKTINVCNNTHEQANSEGEFQMNKPFFKSFKNDFKTYVDGNFPISERVLSGLSQKKSLYEDLSYNSKFELLRDMRGMKYTLKSSTELKKSLFGLFQSEESKKADIAVFSRKLTYLENKLQADILRIDLEKKEKIQTPQKTQYSLDKTHAYRVAKKELTKVSGNIKQRLSNIDSKFSDKIFDQSWNNFVDNYYRSVTNLAPESADFYDKVQSIATKIVTQAELRFDSVKREYKQDVVFYNKLTSVDAKVQAVSTKIPGAHAYEYTIGKDWAFDFFCDQEKSNEITKTSAEFAVQATSDLQDLYKFSYENLPDEYAQQIF